MRSNKVNPTSPEPIACPACDGPPLHPGRCLDQDGYVLPAYETLARLWEEQGRPELSEEELVDIDELLDEWGEEDHAE